jgi:hypothetical protein
MAAVSGRTFGPPKPIRSFCHDDAGATILHMCQAKCQRILAADASEFIHHAFDGEYIYVRAKRTKRRHAQRHTGEKVLDHVHVRQRVQRVRFFVR